MKIARFLLIFSFGLMPLMLVLAQTTTSPVSSEVTIEQLQQQIKSLLVQIEELKSQIETVKTELKFTKALRRGMTGEEVKELQQFLKKFPDIYPEGLVTGYFGSLTEAAVKKLQQKQGIEPAGNVGQKTLDKLNELVTEGAGASGIAPPGILTAPGIQKKLCATTTPDTIAPVISDLIATSTTATTTQIKWTTNEKANSKVWYGLTTPVITATPTAIVSSSDFVLAHELTLTGLTATSTYYYVAVSADPSGNATTSAEKSFMTLGQ